MDQRTSDDQTQHSALQALEKKELATGLYIVGTPIGNLADITLRALSILSSVSIVFAEDTRRTRQLFSRYGITTHLQSYHKFNEAARIDLITSQLQSGKAVALVSDAGMPVISDPGARIITACRENELPVYVIPGPCSISTTIALSGIGGQGYLFDGFLDRKSATRKRQLTRYIDAEHPVVLFESPYRLIKLMNEIEEVLGARMVYVGRELTKKFEELIAGTPAAIRDRFKTGKVKGELVVIISPKTTV